MKRTLLSLTVLLICTGLASCGDADSTEEMTSAADTAEPTSAASEYTYYPDEQPVGYYKRCAVSAEADTVDQLKEMNRLAKKGHLVLKDDWTAYFELDGERTEYTYDRKNLYLKEDTDRKNGFSYVHINGRLVVNYGTRVEQYLILTDKEREEYLKTEAEKDTEAE